MEVGVDHQVTVTGRQPGHGHPVGGHTKGSTVRLHHSLGDAGGAGGEQDVARVVRPEARASPFDLGPPGRRRTVEEGRPRRGARRCISSGHHDGVEIRELRPRRGERCHIVGAEKVGDRHQHSGAAPAEHVGRFGSLKARVDGDDDRASLQRAKGGHHPLQAVRGPDPHAIPRLGSRRHQRGAEGTGRLVELGVGQAHLAIDHGDALRVLSGGTGGHGGDGPPATRGVHAAAGATGSPTFIRRARLPPMILRTVSPGRPCSSWT